MLSLSQIVSYKSADIDDKINDIKKDNETNSKNDKFSKDKKSYTVVQKSTYLTEQNDNKEAKKEESLLDLGFLKFWKKKAPVEEEHLDTQNF